MRRWLPPLLACVACSAAFAGVRWYSAETCDGQYPLGYDGPFGCVADLTTGTGDVLQALSLALPVCALAFAVLFVVKLAK